MPTPHPSAAGGATSALVFSLLVGQVFHLVFSNKTKHDGLCLDVREKLAAAGLNVWQQSANIPKDSDNWFNEWYPNAIKAVKIVCFISVDYLKSPFCMREFGIALARKNMLVVACDPLDEIKKMEYELDRYPHASNALGYLDGGGQVIMPGEDTVAEILKFLPSAAPPQTQPEPQRAPALGLTPPTPAPQLSQIRTLAALSDATQETVEDLLGYSATDLEAVFTEMNLSTVGKKRIKRELEGLRAALEPEPEHSSLSRVGCS